MRNLIYLSVLAGLVLFTSCKEDEQIEEELEICFELPSNTVLVGESVVFENCTEDADRFEWSVDGVFVSSNADLSFLFSKKGISIIELSAFVGSKIYKKEKTMTVGTYQGLAIEKAFATESAEIRGALATNDGGLLLDYFSSDPVDIIFRYKLLKLSSSFEKEWEWIGPDRNTNFFNSTLYERPSEGYLFTKNWQVGGYTSGFLYYLDSTGTTELLGLPYREDGFNGYLELTDSLLYIGSGGFEDDYGLIIQKTDLFGNLGNRIELDFSTKSVIGYDLVESGDGFLMLGMLSDAGTDRKNEEIILIQTDSDFNIEWQKTYDFENIEPFLKIEFAQNWKLHVDDSGDVLIFTYPLVSKVDSQGDIIWRRNYNDENDFSGFARGDVERIQDFFVMSFWGNVIALNSDGTERWRLEVRNSTEQLEVIDNEIIVIGNKGRTVNGEAVSGTDVVLYKINSSGSLIAF